MSETKVYYRRCNEKGEEILEGSVSSKERKWLDKLDNLNCEMCDSDTSIGVYLISISRGETKDQEYYCSDCCHDENMFEQFRENYDELSVVEISEIL